MRTRGIGLAWVDAMRAIGTLHVVLLSFVTISLPLASPVLAVAEEPCAEEDRLGALIGQVITTRRASEIDSKDEFWKHSYFMRVRGWPGNRLNDRAWIEEQEVEGADFLVYESDLRASVHCEDNILTEADLVYPDELTDESPFTIRRKGNMTLHTPKGAFKIALDDDLFDMDRINLNSNWHNPVGGMRQKIAWTLFADAAVPASRHTYAKFCVKDQYKGLYSVIEQVDKEFLRDRFVEADDGNLYKMYHQPTDIDAATLHYRDDGRYFNASVGNPDGGSDWKCRDAAHEDPPRPAVPKVCYAQRSRLPQRYGWDCEWEERGEVVKCEHQRTYQLKTNDDPNFDEYEFDDQEWDRKRGDNPVFQDYRDLATLIRVLNGRDLGGASLDSERYLRQTESVLNVREFARWAAANALLGAWDNYMATRANFYLYNSGPEARVREMSARKDAAEDELDELKDAHDDGNVDDATFERRKEELKAAIDAIEDERAKTIVNNPRFHFIPWDYDNIMGAQWWDTNWATMDLTRWHERYTGGTNDPTQIPPVTYLMENRAFRDYYLDAAACLLNERFNPMAMARFLDVEANKILPALYMESAHGGEPPFDGRATNLRVSSALKWRAARIEQEYYDVRDSGDRRRADILHQEAVKAWNLVKFLRDNDDDFDADQGLRRLNGQSAEALHVARERFKLRLPNGMGGRPAHTHAKYNLDQVYYQGLAGDPYLGGGAHPNDGQKVLGLIDYVQIRYDSAWDQIRRYRGRGPSDYSSGVCSEILSRDRDNQPLPY